MVPLREEQQHKEALTLTGMAKGVLPEAIPKRILPEAAPDSGVPASSSGLRPIEIVYHNSARDPIDRRQIAQKTLPDVVRGPVPSPGALTPPPGGVVPPAPPIIPPGPPTPPPAPKKTKRPGKRKVSPIYTDWRQSHA